MSRFKKLSSARSRGLPPRRSLPAILSHGRSGQSWQGRTWSSWVSSNTTQMHPILEMPNSGDQHSNHLYVLPREPCHCLKGVCFRINNIQYSWCCWLSVVCVPPLNSCRASSTSWWCYEVGDFQAAESHGFCEWISLFVKRTKGALLFPPGYLQICPCLDPGLFHLQGDRSHSCCL